MSHVPPIAHESEGWTDPQQGPLRPLACPPHEQDCFLVVRTLPESPASDASRPGKAAGAGAPNKPPATSG
jgi:hypothetical protein